jgi:membrane protease subunit (stomatin/prohibitin family)
MTDGISSGKVKGGGAASDMAGMMMGMNIAKEMMESIDKNKETSKGEKPNFCPNCGQKTGEGKFCGNCGEKLV